MAKKSEPENKSIVQAFKELVAHIVDIIKKALSRGNLTQYQKEYLEMEKEQAEHIRTLFLDSLDKASENYKSEQKNNTVENSVKKSLNPSFEYEYDKWDKKDPLKHFIIGKVSKALSSIGIKNKSIVWDSSKIIKIKSKHPEMTDLIIKQVPKIIESPIVIMQSKSFKSRITIFGEVYSGNNPILAVLELHPSKNNVFIDEIKLASAYQKNNAQNFINSSDILYIDSNKNRVDNWIRFTGLQLPVNQTIINSNNSISNFDKNVKNSFTVDSDYSYKKLINKPDMPITIVDDKKDYSPNKATRNNVLNSALQSALSVGHKDKSGNTFVYVNDIKTNVMVSKRSLRHSLDRRLSIIAPVTENIGAILRVMVIIRTTV